MASLTAYLPEKTGMTLVVFALMFIWLGCG
jgi:hypothetical protein